MSNAPSLPRANDLFSDASSPREMAERQEALVKAATESTASGLGGETFFAGQHETGAITIAKRADRKAEVRKAMGDLAVSPDLQQALNEQLSKEWTLGDGLTTGNPVGTGLVPFDLEAPAKLLAPRPTPLRNSIARVKGSGASRRFKTISGFTGTGTGGQGTLQPGLNGTDVSLTGIAGPGGLAYLRPPYISYAGFDTTLSYVSWGLSDSVSWQAEYQGAGFEDIRSLSNTALLYSTMLMDERLMLYGRGVTAGGYAGALGSVATNGWTSASVSGTGAGTSGSIFAVVAPDAGDMLGTTGGYHQGPTSASAAGFALAAASNAPIINITDSTVAGALGYNVFISSVAAGPYRYAGRTGSNQFQITAAQNNSAASIAAGAADNSTYAQNFDGLLTNTAASGGYVKRLNSVFSTSAPGTELQSCFSSLFDSVKADPDEVWLNGHDRNQLSNALLSGGNVNNYAVRINAPDNASGVTVGALVQGIVNQITGKELEFNVHPWMPQGNVLVRSTSLPIPDSNVSATSQMVMVQDYVAIQWPVVQFTYDASTLEIGTFVHYAPGWNGLIQGVQLSG